MQSFLAAAAGWGKDLVTRSACAMAVKAGESAGSAWLAMVLLARSRVAANARRVLAAERTAGRVVGPGRSRRRESASAILGRLAEEASQRCHRAVASAGLQSLVGRSGC